MTPKAKLLLTFALVLAPAAAHAAATPGVKQGTIMIGAERLFGLSLSHTTNSTGNNSTSTDETSFTLLYSSAPTVHSTPRVAIDYVPIDGLTVGGGLGIGFGSIGGDNGPSSQFVVVSPRAGYVLGLSHPVGLWLRGGFTYFWMNTDFPSTAVMRSSHLTGLSLDLEPTLLWSVFEHLGFTAGLQVNLPLTGSFTGEAQIGGITTSTSNDRTIRNVGILFGMVGSF